MLFKGHTTPKIAPSKARPTWKRYYTTRVVIGTDEQQLHKISRSSGPVVVG